MKRNKQPTPAGTRFGMLTVISEEESRKFKKGSARQYKCQCNCGKTTVVLGGSLRSGATQSCGCKRGFKHGERRTAYTSHEYSSLAHIIQRCTNPNHKKWKNYGGRGITICEEWNSLSKFSTFLSHVGRSPSKTHTIDRINTNGNYEPGNVRWATRSEQNRNRIDNRWITINGETKCLKDWFLHFNSNEGRFYHRVNKLGWSEIEALVTPSIGRWNME